MCVSHNAINCSNVFLLVTKEHSEIKFAPQNISCVLLIESLIYQRYKHHWNLSLNRGGGQRVRSVLSAQTLCQGPRWDNQSRVKELEWLPALPELKPGLKKKKEEKGQTKTEKQGKCVLLKKVTKKPVLGQGLFFFLSRHFDSCLETLSSYIKISCMQKGIHVSLCVYLRLTGVHWLIRVCWRRGSWVTWACRLILIMHRTRILQLKSKNQWKKKINAHESAPEKKRLQPARWYVSTVPSLTLWAVLSPTLLQLNPLTMLASGTTQISGTNHNNQLPVVFSKHLHVPAPPSTQ